MTLMVLTMTVVVLAAAEAVGAPNDFRIISGSLVQPATLPPNGIAEIKGDDGETYYADLRPLTAVPEGVQSGARLTLIGFEGARADQIQVHLVKDVENPVAREPRRPLQKLRWVSGNVQSVSRTTVTLKTRNGSLVAVDMARLAARMRLLAPGEAVTVFGFARDGNVVASGFVQETGRPPGATDPATVR